jgi:urease accessory protein
VTADLLRLIQWLSPAFPVGSFAYSHGLESAMVSGAVRDGAGVREWVGDVLAYGSGRNDAILLARGLAGGDLEELSDLARAMAASSERLREMMDQGAAFAMATSALTGLDLPARPLPLAVAQAARGLDLPVEMVLAVYLQGFAGALVMAAVKFIPLGQTEGQGILQALQPLILQVAADAARPDADFASSAFGADMAAMEHETLEVRIFRT